MNYLERKQLQQAYKSGIIPEKIKIYGHNETFTLFKIKKYRKLNVFNKAYYRGLKGKIFELKYLNLEEIKEVIKFND